MLKVNDMYRSMDFFNNIFFNGLVYDSELEFFVNIFVVVLKVVVMIFIMGVVIVGNFLVIISVKKFEKFWGRVINYFIVFLVFVDIVVVILVMLFNVS